MRTFPDSFMLVMDAVVTLLAGKVSKRQVDVSQAKLELRKPRFIQKLADFDKDNITADVFSRFHVHQTS